MIVVQGWTCEDIDTVLFQGYASPTAKATLEVACRPPAATSTGGLPFTGLDLGLILVLTVILLVMGAALRRVGRS